MLNLSDLADSDHLLNSSQSKSKSWC